MGFATNIEMKMTLGTGDDEIKGGEGSGVIITESLSNVRTVYSLGIEQVRSGGEERR